jgi:23S rRNA (uracil1939-C5)-methyltransferase
MNPVRILRLAAGGDGLGRLEDGRTVFVPRTAPSDLVELAGLRLHKRFARARVGRVVEAAAARVTPRCPHYVRDDCGGCQLQHLESAAQREARRGFVGEALRRLARRDTPDPALVPAAEEFDYRTKITLAVSADGRRIGLHPYDRPDQVFELEWCHITVPDLMRVWQALRTVRHLLPPRLESVVLRRDRQGGIHLVLRSAGAEAWSGAARLHAALRERDVPATIWWQSAQGAPRAMAGAR